ncbi:MAG: acylneuraminate cytidylyltransferase family protein [bacterium]|nr:acylneuraminate cytidylyltransferase family protein [bacterium]
MNVLCVIPARGKSKRVPNKNIRMLLKRPLIAYTIEKAKESKICKRVVVSTNDLEIAKVAREYNVDVVMRPDDLSQDTSPIDDALRHVVRFYNQKENFMADIVVLLQANNPIRRKGEIDKVIKRLIEIDDATAVVTGYLVDQRPEWMKIVASKTGRIEPFMEPTNLYRKQDLPELYLIDGSVLAVRAQTLMETEKIRTAHAFLGSNVYIIVHDAKYSIEIDEEKDFEQAEYYLRKEIDKDMFLHNDL